MDADYIQVESTGDRRHGATADIPAALAEVINATVGRGGNIVIPSFAVRRTQEAPYFLGTLLRRKTAFRTATNLRGQPLAISVTEVFKRHPELFDRETEALLQGGKLMEHFPICTDPDDG